MSFWFEPSRSAPKEQGDGNWQVVDLHPTDLALGKKHKLETWCNGYCGNTDSLTFGTKSDRYLLSKLLGPGFTVFMNEWAPPEIVQYWGRRLEELLSTSMFRTDETAYLRNYADWLQALGRRGIGLYLSN